MKRNTKHEKRLKRLIVTCLLCAIILTVSTYAWFIGMQTVNINTFEVKIAGVEDLALSLDGINFQTDITISEDVLAVLKDADSELKDADKDYGKYVGTYSTGNTNSWTALEPMSSVGVINQTSSKMVLYEKGSLTASKGGYRIMAEAVENSTTEVNGYVAFDLFIKNMSGEAYYDTIQDPHNEEAVYLSFDSAVTTKDSASDNSGIENSVRVAFAQIGRVKSDTAGETVQAITCKDETKNGVKITGICADRSATIWEPNDTNHVDNAISWFTKSCKNRESDGSWAETLTACTPIVDGTEYPTYAISGNVDHTAQADVYDGFNTYEGTIVEQGTNKIANVAAANKLIDVDTFTDTEKAEKAQNRVEFMRLAPNSITKVRVYVYLEGQDVDNYDFASLGNNIMVNFGLTKERYTAEDIEGEEAGN